MDIDTAYAEFLKKEREVNVALERVEAEQAAGRTGLEAWRNADRLNRELQALADSLAHGIEVALAHLAGSAR